MKKKNTIIKNEFKEIINILNTFELTKNTNFTKLCEFTIAALKRKKKIIFFGNGGSAADAQHLAAEFVVKYSKKRSALPAISLATDTSILTAIGNDFNFNSIFSRQIEAIGEEGDIAIAITTSGNSTNLIEAIKIANKKKINTFCFSGNLGGKLKRYVRYPIIIPSKKTSAIQAVEIIIGQIYCEIVEKKFF